MFDVRHNGQRVDSRVIGEGLAGHWSRPRGTKRDPIAHVGGVALGAPFCDRLREGVCREFVVS